MINKNELRLRNWVSYRGEKEGYVSNLGSGGFETCRHYNDLPFGSNDIEDYEPIPITEEWLLKFGFEKSDDHQLGYIINEIGFHYDYHFKRFYLEIGDNCDLFKFKNIKYVHQLQNLYFALTGEELTINA